MFREAAKKLRRRVAVRGRLIIGVIASRVAGHLSRNLEPSVAGAGRMDGAHRSRRAAADDATAAGRAGVRGASPAHARRWRTSSSSDARARSKRSVPPRLRETARQVAHELKNPLTPIRFAVERLRRDAPPELAETVEVLAIESQRLEAMARSFAQFGRLPEGPRAEVDVGELARYTARATIPPDVAVRSTSTTTFR